jgi:multidrug efflux pump subunit AcrB
LSSTPTPTESIRNLRDKVKDAQSKLPKDAKDSVVTQISVDDKPIMEVAVTGPYDGYTMHSYAETLKDEMQKVPGVREVNISGGDEKEYEVAYLPSQLLFYGRLTPQSPPELLIRTTFNIQFAQILKLNQ